MREHADAVAEQMRAERAHVPVRGEILVLDRLRFACERIGKVAVGTHAGHAIERPHEIDGGRARCAKLGDRRIEARGIPPRGEHDAPRRGDADRRRTAHGKITDRLRHFGGAAAIDVGFLERQTALIEQAQVIALPEDGADRIVGCRVEVTDGRVRYACGRAG